jgi:cytosine/adenosine deaminase-related metal-dependent hydrolase
MESSQELEFLASGRGALQEFLEQLGALRGPWSPVADPWSEYLGGGGRWNLVHANYPSRRDLERLQEPSWRERVAAVTYCPRTHAHFGHSPHPWRKLLELGIPVALGTDSLASNPDLSVLEEARWLAARHPEVAPTTFLDMLTLHGAKAMGLEDHYGTLESGKSATMTVLDCGKARRATEAILDPAVQVVGLMVDGRWLRVPPSQ